MITAIAGPPFNSGRSHRQAAPKSNRSGLDRAGVKRGCGREYLQKARLDDDDRRPKVTSSGDRGNARGVRFNSTLLQARSRY